MLNVTFLAPVLTYVQAEVPTAHRSTASSITLLFATLLGAAGGPLAVWALSDMLGGAYRSASARAGDVVGHTGHADRRRAFFRSLPRGCAPISYPSKGRSGDMAQRVLRHGGWHDPFFTTL